MRYLSILISLLLCLSLLSCGNLEPKETIDSSSDNESDTTADNLDESTVPGEPDHASESDETEPVIDISILSDEEYFADYFTPVLRFVVASDVHIVARKCVEEERFAELFKQAYAYSDSHEKYNSLDGIFIVGDCTDNGSPSEFNKFFSIIEENAREGTVVRAVMGNHDYWYNRQTAPVLFKNASGYDDIDAHLVINGFHFIMLSPRERGNAFSADQQNWLRTKLREAADSDETGTRPIFVFNHQHISGTVYGSEDWGNPELKDELFIYPQAIDFSGHSHYPLSDPRSIWQGEFTALGTGSLSYFDMGLAGLKTGGVRTKSDKFYAMSANRPLSDASQYYIVEVDANNAVQILGYDLTGAELLMDPILLRSVGDKSEFKYTDARKDNAAVPYFPEETEFVIDSFTGSSAILKFTHAECEDTVQRYRCELYKGEKLIRTINRVSCSFYAPMPEYNYLQITGLGPDTEYTIKIYAVSPWVVESEPFVFNIKTPPKNTQ